MWKDIKHKVCRGEPYKNQTWYTELLEHQKRLVEDLKSIQETLGLDKLIEPQENYVRAKFIEERIDELLVEENFFFYKIFK